MYGSPQKQSCGQGCTAVSRVVTDSPSAETWDDNRIKPLYEQLLNQFHAADLDGSVSLTGSLMHDFAMLTRGDNITVSSYAGMGSLILSSCERCLRLLRMAAMAAPRTG